MADRCGLLLQMDCPFVCLSVMTVISVKVAELIIMPFGIWTRVSLRHHILDGHPYLQTRRGNFEGKKGPAQDMPVHVWLSLYWRCSIETLVLVSRCLEDMKNGLGLGLDIKVLVLILVLKKSLGLDEKVSIFSRP